MYTAFMTDKPQPMTNKTDIVFPEELFRKRIVTYRLYQFQEDKIGVFAKENGLKKNQVIRLAIEEFLQKHYGEGYQNE